MAKCGANLTPKLPIIFITASKVNPNESLAASHTSALDLSNDSDILLLPLRNAQTNKGCYWFRNGIYAEPERGRV